MINLPKKTHFQHNWVKGTFLKYQSLGQCSVMFNLADCCWSNSLTNKNNIIQLFLGNVTDFAYSCLLQLHETELALIELHVYQQQVRTRLESAVKTDLVMRCLKKLALARFFTSHLKNTAKTVTRCCQTNLYYSSRLSNKFKHTGADLSLLVFDARVLPCVSAVINIKCITSQFFVFLLIDMQCESFF